MNMIFSDRQYQVSKAELSKLQAALAAARLPGGMPWLQQIEVDALKSQIADIEAEMAEYDLVKSGQITFSETCALSELPRVLTSMMIKGHTWFRWSRGFCINEGGFPNLACLWSKPRLFMLTLSPRLKWWWP